MHMLIFYYGMFDRDNDKAYVELENLMDSVYVCNFSPTRNLEFMRS